MRPQPGPTLISVPTDRGRPVTTSNASVRRNAAIRDLVDSVLNAENAYTLSPGVDVDKLAADIRELARLGRTAHWREEVENWADLVTMYESRTDLSYLRWAFLTGSTRAGWVA